MSLFSRPKLAERYVHTKFQSYIYGCQQNYLNNLRTHDDWLLIILDACRYDRFIKFHKNFIEASVEPLISAGHNTFDYVRLNWPGEYEYPYVSGAAPINATEFDFEADSLRIYGVDREDDGIRQRYQGYIPADHLHNIKEVWREYWDEDLGVCPPEPVTDVALRCAPSTSRMVVHYFQPHVPYIGEKQLLGDISRAEEDETLRGGAIESGIWEAARDGDLSRNELIELYDSNLKRVLPEVARLVDNTEFDRVVVTADHGEALGEYGCYSHIYPMHPKVRKIPWAEISGATAELEAYTPNEYERTEVTASVNERLKDLGYL